MNETHLEPVRAAWNGAESPRPWHSEGVSLISASGEIIGAISDTIDRELCVRAVNIMPLVFADHARNEDAAVKALVDAGAQRLLEAERSVIADAKALVARCDAQSRQIEALLTGNEAQRDVNMRLRKTNAHLHALVELARKQLVDAGFRNLADAIGAAARIE